MGPRASKGMFISFEGGEGAGKSTHVRMAAEALEAEGHEVIMTAEPGGTPISQCIRGVLLDTAHQAMEPVTELLLYAAARRQHLQELILPALEEGKVVITDRFSDSTAAYQGTGRGLDMRLIEELDRIVTGGIKPELTVLLDMDVELGLERNRGAGKQDRLEMEQVEFHKRVREGFLAIAKAEPERVKLVDASGSKQEVQTLVMEAMREALTRK
ncbi:MAG: dTMP kinase [Thermodesulfovibrionales bacterium]|nr:dTMP kinase [Thermodesulfovibrionales bacterium]